CLNSAGMLAPLVALAPTMDVGACSSAVREADPKLPNGELAPWVVANIDNNVTSLLCAGAAGLVFGYVLVAILHKDPFAPVRTVPIGTFYAMSWATGMWIVVYWAQQDWAEFETRAHGFAAVGMFLFLIGAVVAKALEHRRRGWSSYLSVYGAIAVAMVVTGIVVWRARPFEQHTVFALEAIEIGLFALFWVVQTIEHWNEEPAARSPASTLVDALPPSPTPVSEPA
ncbi:hypothetical protein B7486_59620, partial [cyanobacterium TDX16]